MFNFKNICWGLLVVMTVGAVEPAVAALDEVQPSILPATSLLAADPDLASVFSGKGIPTSIKLKDLTPE